MSSKKRGVSPEEAELWGRVAATVRPKSRRRAASDPAPKEPRDFAVPKAPKPEPSKAPKRFAAAPQNRAAEKRVRRGTLEIGARLDLHGHTQATAYAALVRFLSAASARGDRAVIVVTGMGRGGLGVLKQRLPEWLAEPGLRALVSGYAPAHRRHGGAGAFYVLLKRPRTPE